MIVEESIHIVFDETNNLSSRKIFFVDNNERTINKGIKDLISKEISIWNDEESNKVVDEKNHEKT